jgi:iron complex outermembrane receptor protein
MRAYASIDRYDDGPPAQLAIKSTEMNCNTGGTANGGMWWCGKLPNWDQVDPAWISANNIMDPLTVNAINNNAGNFPVAFNSRFQTKPGLRRDNIISNFRIDYETAGGYTISSLTSYNTEKSMNIVNLTFRNGDNVANPLAFLPNTAPFIKWMVATQSESDDFSQELRIVSPQDQRLRWLAGASFLELTNPGGTGVYGTTPFGRAVVSSTFRSRSSTPAIFGGIYYDITEALTFSGELRFQQDKIFRQALTGPPAVLIPGGGPRFNEKYNSLAPRATLDWKFATDQMVYLQYARGYRPGGFNPALAAQSPAVQALFPPGVGFSFEEDRLDNFELGLKSTWLAGRIQTRAAAYYAQWRDGQQNTSLTFVDPNTGVVNIVGAVQNIGEINLQGIELEGEFQATDNLVLAGTFGYNDSDIRVFVCGDCRIIGPSSNVTGNRLPNAPRTEWSASGTYTAQLVRDWESFFRLDYTHRGESYVTASNSAIIGSSDQVNLRVGLRRDNFTLQAYARNLLYDKAPLSGSLGADALFTPTTIAGREVRYSLPDKRMFGISAAFEF